MATGTLTGLQGIRKKKTPASFFRTYDEIESILNQGEAATAAGKKGAIDVYRDDKRKVRCNLHENCMTTDHQVFDDLDKAKEWIATNIAKIEIESDDDNSED